MACPYPQLLGGPHVWVRNHGDYGEPVPGVVVCWQHSPVHTVTTAEWVALVVGHPSAGDDGVVGRCRATPADSRRHRSR